MDLIIYKNRKILPTEEICSVLKNIFERYQGMLTETGGKWEIFEDDVIDEIKTEYSEWKDKSPLLKELQNEISKTEKEEDWIYKEIYLAFLKRIKDMIYMERGIL